MIGVAILLVVIGVVLLLLGAFVAAAKFLLWIGIILAIVGAVIWLVGGRRSRL